VLEAVEVMLYYMLEAVDGALCMLRWLAWPKGFCPMVAISRPSSQTPSRLGLTRTCQRTHPTGNTAGL